MIIDFEKTEEKVVENFKGGNGTLIMRAADDAGRTPQREGDQTVQSQIFQKMPTP